MKTYIAMLRGINVSGQKLIKMPALKAVFEAQGFEDVETYIQSGNVVFRSAKGNAVSIARSIEAAIEGTFGFNAAVLIRQHAELHGVVAASPFIGREGTDPGRLYVTFLSSVPRPEDAARLTAAPLKNASDEFVLAGREVYLHCPTGYGTTQLSNTFFEKLLDLPATTRNWNTVTTLLAMAANK